MTLRDLFGFRAANTPHFGPNADLPDVMQLVHARKLHAAFEANEIAAEQEYKPDDLLVNGVVSGVVRRSGRIVVELESGDAYWPVLCRFAEAEADTVAALEKGEPVLVICRFAGRWARSIVLDGCRLTEGTVEVLPGGRAA